MPSRPPQRRKGRNAPSRGEWFDYWFPRGQRVVVLLVGIGGIVVAIANRDIGLGGTFAGLLLWQGYQEAKRPGE